MTPAVVLEVAPWLILLLPVCLMPVARGGSARRPARGTLARVRQCRSPRGRFAASALDWLRQLGQLYGCALAGFPGVVGGPVVLVWELVPALAGGARRGPRRRRGEDRRRRLGRRRAHPTAGRVP